MSDLRHAWPRAALGSVAQSVRNGLFARRPNDRGDGVRILRISSVRHGMVNVEDSRFVAEVPAEKVAQFALTPGDLLLTRYNGSRHLVGISGLVPTHAGPLLHPDKLIRVVVDSRHAEPKFINYQLESQTVRSFLEPRIRTSAGQSGISGKDVRAIPLVLPPLEAQRQIVEILEDHLSHLDAVELELKSASARLNLLRRAQREAAIAPEPHWRVLKAAELTSGARSDVVIGPFGSNLTTKDYAAAGVPLVFVRDVRAEEFGLGSKFVSTAKARDLAPHQVLDGDVLMTKMGDPPGDTAVYRGQPGIITADVLRLRTALEHDPRFIALALSGDRARAQVLSITSGVAQKKISLARFRSTIQLPVPARDEQVRRFEEFAEQASQVARAEKAIAVARAGANGLRHAVLAAAFEGKLTGQNTDTEVIEELAGV